MLKMDALLAALHASPAHTRAHASSFSEGEHAMRVRALNQELGHVCEERVHVVEGLPQWHAWLEEMAAAFLWQLPACEGAVEVADTFNGAHVTGLVLAKLVFVVLSDLQADAQAAAPHTVFAACPEMHTTRRAFAEHAYTDARRFREALQAQQGAQLRAGHVRAVGEGLVYALFTLGGYCASHAHSGTILDEVESREAKATDAGGTSTGGGGGEFALARRAARQCVVQLLCLLRDYVIFTSARSVELLALAAPAQAAILSAVSADDASMRTAALHPRLFASVRRVKRRRLHAAALEDAQAQEATLWAHIVKKIGVDLVGSRPRKISAGMRALLQDVCMVLGSDLARAPEHVSVSESLVRVLETALRNFYVIPSASTYRSVQLMEELLPGQRMQYAFDYMHYDTGSLSQVVYFENPLAKQKPPPSGLESWEPESAAGPVAAFLQLEQRAVVHTSDAQDPLGLRGERYLITRPAEAVDVDERAAARKVRVFERCTFCVTAGHTYLVDREAGVWYRLGKQRHAERPYLVLVGMYARVCGMVPELCGIAINSAKLAGV
jgi:hypothetical protein